MKNLLYFVIFTLLLGCYANDKAEIKMIKGKAVVEGKIQNFNSELRILRFAGFSIIKDIEQYALLDTLGNFRTEIEIYNPQDIDLYYENSHLTFFLHPGDSLYININADQFRNESYPDYKISGNNTAASINIRDYLKSHTIFFYDRNFNPDYNKPFKIFLSDFKKNIDAENSALSIFNKQNKPTQEFISWAKNYSLYRSFSIFLNYYSAGHNDCMTKISDAGIFPIDDSIIGNSSYTWFLSEFPVWRYSAGDSISMKLLRNNDIQNAFARTFENILKKEKPGLSRDIIFYKLFNKFLDGNSGFKVEDGVLLCNKYKTLIDNNVLTASLTEKLSGINDQDKKKETILDLKSGTKSRSLAEFWEKLNDKHKNKTIYIDIWSTSCGICRSELSHANELYGNFKDKPVAFVNLCLNSKKDDWEKVIADIRRSSDNYFFTLEDSFFLAAQLKVDGFPTHMIINKKGELIKKEIPGLTSGDEIKNLLNKLIDE